MDGKTLKEIGILQAETSANTAVPNWSEIAYQFVLNNRYRLPDQFMIEDIRNLSVGYIPQPPHNRSWGSISLRLIKSGVIKKIGIGQVSNPKAHCANANIYSLVNQRA